MRSFIYPIAAAAALQAGLLVQLPAASAAPVSATVAEAIRAPAATPAGAAVEQVQYRGRGHWRGHRHYRGRGWGWGGFGAGLAAGAIGSALLAPRTYSQGYYGDDAVAYCSSRFKSYDPASGTYMGYDGMRHACP